MKEGKRECLTSFRISFHKVAASNKKLRPNCFWKKTWEPRETNCCVVHMSSVLNTVAKSVRTAKHMVINE